MIIQEHDMSLVELLQNLFKLGQLESEIATSAIIFILVIIIGWTIYSIVRTYLSRWAKNTKTKIDDEILRNIKAPLLLLAFLLGTSFGLQPLSFLEPYSEILALIIAVTQIVTFTFIAIRILNVLTSWLTERARREKRMSEHLLFVLKQVIRAIVYLFAFLALLVAFH